MIVPCVVLLVGLLMMACERARPGRAWPQVRGWWWRAGLFNALQAVAILTVGRAFDGQLQGLRATLGLPRLFDAFGTSTPGTAGAALAGYVVLTFVYYWWHRARHEVPALWRTLHQMHHTPQRIEVLTSFYKHPLELVTNSMIPGLVLYVGLGLRPEAAVGATLLAGLAELFYHWNVRTPRWLGYVIQRPESHCVHHEEGRHASNYGDLPLWDMLFGTFHNPATFDGRCGLGPEAEQRVGALLLAEDVSAPATASTSTSTSTSTASPRRVRVAVAVLLALGLLRMLADAAGQPALAAVAGATAASPAPKVFTSLRGHEALSARFRLEWTDRDGVAHVLPLDAERTARLQGPYNRRNVLGAALAFGPVLLGDERTRPMLDAILERSLGGPERPLLRELGVDPASVVGPVRVCWEPRSGADLGLYPLSVEAK